MSTPAPQNPLCRRTLLAACLLGLLAPLAGCDTGGSSSSAEAEPKTPVPVAKFEHIFEDVRLQFDATGTGNTHDAAPTGGANTEYSHSVTHELTPPQAEGENYRGTITITRKYTVTMYTFNREKEDAAEEGGSDRSFAEDELTIEEDPLADFALGADPTAPLKGGSPIKTRDGQDVKVFKLEYLDGAWRLLTEPDPETEGSIKLAFEYALRRQ